VAVWASFGRGASCFFHSASLRKKRTGLSAPLCKVRASPGPPWPVLSRILAASPSDKRAYQTQPLPPPALGLHPAGARRGRLYITVRYANLPAPPRHTPAGPSGAGPASVRFATHVSGSSRVRRGPPIRPRARRGGSLYMIFSLCDNVLIMTGITPSAINIHVALSGGGFRAAFFHLGVVRRLFQLGLFTRIKTISSVSGGSFLNGLVGLHFDSITSLDSFDELITKKLTAFSRRDIRSKILRNFILRGLLGWIPPISRWVNESDTQRYASEFNNHLFDRKTLADLSDKCRFIINSTNLHTGCRFRFEKKDFGDYRTGYSYDVTFFPIGDAIAASGAFPGFFSPFQFSTSNFGFTLRNPDKVDTGKNACVPSYIQLSDGGVYDNLGVEPFEREYAKSPNSFVIVSDAAQSFDDRIQEFSWLTSIYRCYLVTYNRNLNRVRQFVGQKLIKNEWNGVYFNLGRSCRYYRECKPIRGDPPATISTDLGWGDAEATLLGKMRTDLNTFHDIEIAYLIYHGSSLVDVSLQKWHPEFYQQLISTRIEKPIFSHDDVKSILENSSGPL